jgi:CHAT domain-containing protein
MKRMSGHYGLLLRPLRLPTALDRTRAEAVRGLSRGNILRAHRDFLAATSAYTQTLHRWRAEDRRERGLTLYWIAQSREDLNQWDATAVLEGFQGALRELKARGNQAGEAMATEGIARAYYHLDKPEESIVNHLRALDLFSSTGDLAGQAEVLANLALVHSTHLDLQEALPRYRAALALFEDLGASRERLVTLTNLARVCLELGRPSDAVSWLEKALSAASNSAEMEDDKHTALAALGLAYHKLGDDQTALRYLRQARSSRGQSTEAEYGRVVALINLCTVLLDEGRTEPAKLELALAAAQEARNAAHRIKDETDEAYTLSMAGWVREFQGRHKEALQLFGQVRNRFRERGDKSAEASVLSGIAQAERALGHLDRAQEAMQRSLELVENVRSLTSSFEMRSAYWADLRSRYDFYIDLLIELDRRKPGHGYAVRAFEASESARARSVLDELVEAGTNLRASADPQLLAKDEELARKIEQTEQERLRKREKEGRSSPGIVDLDRNLAALTADRELVAAELRASSPLYASFKVHPRTLVEVQREALDRNTVLLSFWLGEKKSVLWRIDRATLESYDLPGRGVIEPLAIQLRDYFALGGPTLGEGKAAQVMAELSRHLLKGVEGRLNATRLMIVPDRALRYVPFAALAPSTAGWAKGWPERPLIVDHDIISLPSASALALLREELKDRRPAPHALAVLADPVFRRQDSRLPHKLQGGPSSRLVSAASSLSIAKIDTLPELRYSKEEADGILALVPEGEGFSALGFDASLKTAMSPRLSRYRIVHFATHSMVDERPDSSGLVFSQFDAEGRLQDGFLTALQVYKLRLPVELVVLSACQTSQGADLGGEGIGRFTRGFLYAGARRVVVTLWSIRDEATSRLMLHFYEGLLHKGLSPSEALRRAQISIRAEKRWRSPYFWAGFVLQGEW